MGRQTNFVLNTTQEDIDNILPDNKELMEDFINYLESTDHAKTSLKVYKNVTMLLPSGKSVQI